MTKFIAPLHLAVDSHPLTAGGTSSTITNGKGNAHINPVLTAGQNGAPSTKCERSRGGSKRRGLVCVPVKIYGKVGSE